MDRREACSSVMKKKLVKSGRGWEMIKKAYNDKARTWRLKTEVIERL